jgi:O-antigen/teichoic acid export membrane protein
LSGERELHAPIPQPDDAVDILDTPAAGGRVIRGSALRAVGYGVGVLLGALAAAFMIRHLGPVDWGRYVTVMSLMSIAGGLSEAGMTTIGVREYSTRERRDRDLLMRNLLGFRLAITVAGVLLSILFTVLASYPVVVVEGTALAGLGVVFVVMQQTVGVPMAAGLRLGWQSTIDLVRQLASLAAVATLVAVGASLLPFLAVPIPVGALVLFLTVLLVRGDMPLLPAFARDQWARVLRLSVAFAAAAAVATFYVSITVVLTSLLASGRETGYYGVSFRIFSVLTAIPLLLVNSAFPVVARAARDDHTRLSYAVQRLFEIAVILGAWLALATALAARVAVDVVAGSGFDRSVGVLRIQAVGLLGTFLAVTLGSTLLSLHRNRALVVSNLLALGLSAALTIALVPVVGARGGAIATVCGELTLSGLYAFDLFVRDRAFGLSLAVVPRVAAATAAAVGLAFVPGLTGIALVAAATAVYGVMLLVTRALPRELLDAFLQPRRAAT